MRAIYFIENETERKEVKRIFRQRMECVAEAAMDLHPNEVNPNMNYTDNGLPLAIQGSGAVVYDIKGEGDPELGWVVYDFSGEGKIYTIEEHDLAGVVNVLPPSVFPFGW